MLEVLAVTDSCRTWRSNMNYAAQLAALCGGSLTGLYVPRGAPLASAPVAGVEQEIKEELVDERWAARRAEADFRRWSGDLGVQRCDWQIAEESPRDVLIRASNWHDVIVLERSSGLDGWTAERIGDLLLAVQTPMLILPPDVGDLRLHTIAVAWNGSVESIRALHAALPLLRRAGRLVLIKDARAWTPPAHRTWPPALAIEDYLASRKIVVETILIDTAPDQAGAKILFEAGNTGAELLVMGAFGRTRFAEHWFGGATLHALRNARMPLLMRH